MRGDCSEIIFYRFGFSVEHGWENDESSFRSSDLFEILSKIK